MGERPPRGHTGMIERSIHTHGGMISTDALTSKAERTGRRGQTTARARAGAAAKWIGRNEQ